MPNVVPSTARKRHRPLTYAEQKARYPQVRFRLRPEEAETLERILRAQGVSVSEWARRHLRIDSGHGKVDARSTWISFKFSEGCLAACSDALVDQAAVVEAIARRSQTHDAAEAQRLRRRVGAYIDARAEIADALLLWSEWHRLQAGGPAPDDPLGGRDPRLSKRRLKPMVAP